MDLKQTRVERLKQFAKKHGVESSPGELARLIGKKPNQVTNLLGGHSSFGEKVARSIEQAAGLPSGWLDADTPDAEVTAGGKIAPELSELVGQVNALPPKQREVALTIIRKSLDLLRESIQPTGESLGNNTALDTTQETASPKRVNSR